MHHNPDIMWLLSAALAGGGVMRFTGMPGGAMLGSTVAVGLVVNLGNFSHIVPGDLLFALQAIIGAMLGQSINRRFWDDFMGIWRPVMAIAAMYTVMAIPFALCLIHISGFDSLTAMLSSTPARIQDMIILAGSTGRDAVTVMLMQLVRQFCIIGITPFILMYLGKGGKKGSSQPNKKKKKLLEGVTAPSMAILFVPAVVGGFLGDLSGHPLGSLLGSFLAVAASRLIWKKAGEIPFPTFMAFIAQCFTGVLLGVRITPDIGDLLASRALPIAMGIVYIIAIGLIISYMLSRKYGWSRELSWISAAPGRTPDMLAISYDLDMNGNERLALVTVHAVRQIYFTLLTSSLVMLF